MNNLIELATQTLDTLKQSQESTAQLSQRINTLAAEHATVIATKDAEIKSLKTELAEMVAFRIAMTTKVSTVLQSGDPAQYEALAVEFLTPAQEKARQKLEAEIAASKAKTAELEAKLTA